MSQINSSRIYRATTDSDVLDLPRSELTSGMTVCFVPILVGMDALTGGGSTNLDGISTLDLAVPTVFDILNEDDTTTRWVLRAKRAGEFSSTGEDADKSLVEPADDDSLIWARVSGAGAGVGSVPSDRVDGSGNNIVDGSGNQLTSP